MTEMHAHTRSGRPGIGINAFKTVLKCPVCGKSGIKSGKQVKHLAAKGKGETTYCSPNQPTQHDNSKVDK